MFLLTVAALVLELPPVLGSPQCQNRSLENRSTKPGVDRPCLCAFDVDRTLTGYQELREECPLNLVKDGVKDYAYLYATPRGFGFLTLSELSQGLNATFCRHCYLGIASAGGAGLDDEKAVLSSVLHAGVARGELYEALPNWTTGENPEEQVESEAPFVVWCAEGQKNLCVKKIVEWYRSERNVSISDEDVYFFDDKEDNISPFVQTNYNAFQVSCGSRNGSRGLCGGRVARSGTRRASSSARESSRSAWRTCIRPPHRPSPCPTRGDHRHRPRGLRCWCWWSAGIGELSPA